MESAPSSSAIGWVPHMPGKTLMHMLRIVEGGLPLLAFRHPVPTLSEDSGLATSEKEQ